jgi:hypothetical protein
MLRFDLVRELHAGPAEHGPDSTSGALNFPLLEPPITLPQGKLIIF